VYTIPCTRVRIDGVPIGQAMTFYAIAVVGEFKNWRMV
jgi:hypothetical protein